MTVIIRCDATPDTGLGHLSRCLALAEALRHDGIISHFAGHFSGNAVTMLSTAGFAVHASHEVTGSDADADALAAFARSSGGGIVVDSYAVTTGWLSRLVAAGPAPVLIDDFGRLEYYGACAGVLNITVGADDIVYRGIEPSRVARGPRVLLVRDALVALRKAGGSAEVSMPPERILITLGGGDLRGLTLPLYHAVRAALPQAAIRALHADGAALARAAMLEASDFPPPATDLAAHYAWADRCIAGGGLTKYECAYLGLPVGIVSQTADQQSETDDFCRRGFATDLAAGGDGRALTERVAAFLHDAAAPTLARATRAHFPPTSAQAAAAFVRVALADATALAPTGTAA